MYQAGGGGWSGAAPNVEFPHTKFFPDCPKAKPAAHQNSSWYPNELGVMKDFIFTFRTTAKGRQNKN